MKRDNVILPPATIGILGGGQLGRMIATEAREMGYHIVTLDPTENSPCAQAADKQIVAGYDSEEGARELAAHADVLTYEFENISSTMAHYLQEHSYLPQGYSLLYTTQNRLREKEAIEKAGIPVAPYRAIHTREDLHDALAQLGYPSVMKTTEGGYDGKGQWVLKQEADLEHVSQVLKDTDSAFILEQFVPFTHEISVIVARNLRGEIKAFPAAENIHRQNILHVSLAPARLSKEILDQAEQIALRLAEAFQLVGLLAIEMFVLSDGRIYINELAPRPHNSGHYTQEACVTSQFEQHIRAICNLPLGETSIQQPTVMVNILGEHLQPLMNVLGELDPACKVHLYGKKEAKAKRKMGHVNVVANDIQTALDKIEALHIWDLEGIRC